MKDFPVGSYLILKSNTRFFSDKPLMSILYKYNYSQVLGFIAADVSGSTEPGDTYLSRFPDIF